MKELFIERNFAPKTLKTIEAADRIIREYQARGYVLTLRQLYYQFVSRDLLANRQTEYKRLGSIVNDARLAGLLDWSAIEDRTRNLRKQAQWDSPAEIIGACASQYREDLWSSQAVRVEVWIEKDALLGVVEGVCNELRVPFIACRGYLSQSEAYAAGRRAQRYHEDGQRMVVLHFGDHDPSGIDMTRDNGARLEQFGRHSDVEIRRLALNWSQIEEYAPPPNPAKDTDSRFDAYREEYGEDCWELDALDPDVISNLVRVQVDDLRDPVLWEEAEIVEQAGRDRLQYLSENWGDVE